MPCRNKSGKAAYLEKRKGNGVMSNLSRFLKKNKVEKKDGEYAPTASLLSENGTPLKWTFRHITSKQDEELREECTVDVPIKGKPGVFRQKLGTSRYLAEMIVASTVVPDLYNKELQDSYGVKSPTDLLYALVDDPGEFQDLCVWIQDFQGFTDMNDKVKEAKN